MAYGVAVDLDAFVVAEYDTGGEFEIPYLAEPDAVKHVAAVEGEEVGELPDVGVPGRQEEAVDHLAALVDGGERVAARVDLAEDHWSLRRTAATPSRAR